MNPERPSWIEIDLQALSSNYERTRSLVGPDSHIIAALKGNAYGHGIELIARCLSEYDIHAFGAGSYADAQAIQHVSRTPVLMFGGPLPPGIPSLLASGVTPTIYNMQLAEAVSSAANGPTDVFIKVDAGLGRLGVPLDDAQEFTARASELEHVRVAGLYTHLTFYGVEEMEWARKRLAAFDALLDNLDKAGLRIPITQGLASTALLAGLTSKANTVCPGSMLYGMCPIDPDLCDFSAFQPVLSGIKSKLIHIRQNNRDRVGVVPMGVADGFQPIPSGSQFDVLVNGQRARVAGVSLEYTNIDLTSVDGAHLGDEVIFVGHSGNETITLEELGASWGTSPLHTLMSFAGHLPRVAA